MKLFICYPRCSTCKKAQNWLDTKGIRYTFRDIKLDPPTAGELRSWSEKSGLPLRKFFNTSGLQYKELHLKDKLPTMSEAEQFKLLASDGMLVKRPLLVGNGFVLVGFKEEEWKARV
jgi:arsenate reductase